MQENESVFIWGGVQSNAVLVLAARGDVQYDSFVFANTGEDSENPATLAYIRDIARPFAMAHGLKFVEVQKRRRDGTPMSLYQYAMSDDNRSIPLPMRMSNGAPGNRKCTVDWKIKPVSRWVRAQGARKHSPAVVGIGISMDEVQRAKDSLIPHQVHEFPLLDRRLSRLSAANIIKEAGLPMPPKSSCWFCPYKKMQEWRDMAEDQPELFTKACELEAKLEAKRGNLGKDRLFLTDRLVPLAEAVQATGQIRLAIYEECTGFCWT